MKAIETVLVLLTLGLSFQNLYSVAFNLLPISSVNMNSTIVESILHPASFLELAARYGYPAGAHEVITEDGYILTLFHIPGTRPAPPVLLFHGILDSADTWIIRGNTSLAITLADANYDVWLGNVRGNRYSRRHVTLNPDVDAEFWNFSFDEHGLYDLPAVIDYILNRTSAEKINMFGHSQGNAMMWALLSSRPEYNEKINVATALAPVCFLSNIVPLYRVMAKVLPGLLRVLQTLGLNHVLGDDSTLTIALRVISRIPSLGYKIGANGILFNLFGVDGSELERGFLPTVVAHAPTWTSIRNLLHYGQLITSGRFARYDHGEAGNRAGYDGSTPPEYELGRVTAKVALLAALNDNVSRVTDVAKLRGHLPNVVRYIINPRAIMNHIDYTWGRTANRYLYPYIFDVLENN